MERPDLADALEEAFDADSDAARVVARAAGDLEDAGTYREDVGVELDVELIVTELADAPEGMELLERWNWWIGSLDLAFDGYDRFLVRD
ncbi:hypothetical protein GCM10028857_00680 [Salinarchaeum chitinilyticum]